MKFSRPVAGRVTVETHYDLTLGWVSEQSDRVLKALDSVIARYRELGGT
jgi:hypothetical protein